MRDFGPWGEVARMGESTSKRVFCSHRGVDKAEVNAFVDKLRAAGIDA